MNRVGILALQGAFAEHAAMVQRLGAAPVQLRCAGDIEQGIDRLILPGGESTAQSLLLRRLGMLRPVRERIEAGMPTLGTCAGMILLASEVIGGDPCIASMTMTVQRNAYGRQLASFHTEAEVRGIGTVPMTFIRAPYATSIGEGTQVLAEVDGRIVAARTGNQLALAFHPELDNDTRIHEYFLSL